MPSDGGGGLGGGRLGEGGECGGGLGEGGECGGGLGEGGECGGESNGALGHVIWTVYEPEL